MVKIASEKITVELMIKLYCRKKHGNRSSLCPKCAELKEYALERLDKCPFGDEKPACKACKIHCYDAEKRNQIKDLMRFSGPRMLLYFPYEYLRHKLQL